MRTGWAGSVYGARAGELLAALPSLLGSATVEAQLPRTSQTNERPVDGETAREALVDTLLELRSIVLATEVSAEDVPADLRLRAAVSEAVGAAKGLALATSSQPTAGDLARTRSGVVAVMLAATGAGLP